jgi:hypothetical protein
MRIIRNDDVAYDTNLDELKRFCAVCDRYNLKILQAITPFGICIPIDVKMDNDRIINLGRVKFADNKPLVDFLLSRNDIIGVHGYYHTHNLCTAEINLGKEELERLGFKPTYFVTPFNEGDYGDEICGLKVSDGRDDRLEKYVDKGKPRTPIAYVHSWRFHTWWTLDKLESMLCRITSK